MKRTTVNVISLPAVMPFFILATCAAMLTVAGLAGTAVGQQETDPAKVMGVQACAECHKSEVAAWEHSSHATKSFSMLTENPKAATFAAKMGIAKADITGNSLCTQCHGTPQLQGGTLHIIQGTSCESCHGAAGPQGTDGWFSVHSFLGRDNKDRTKETAENRARRLELVKERGMNRSADIYEIAKNCYQCHSVPIEKLVNVAGHPGLNAQFELVQWLQGEVRHNFQLDQSNNAAAPTLWLDPLWNPDGRTPAGRGRVMYVVGQLVELETSLRNRAAATAPGAYATGAAGRVAAANGKLTVINSKVDLPEVKQAGAEVTRLFGKLFAPPAPAQQAEFEAAADKVAAAAKKFAETHDGRDLAALDPLVPKTAKGTAYQP